MLVVVALGRFGGGLQPNQAGLPIGPVNQAQARAVLWPVHEMDGVAVLPADCVANRGVVEVACDVSHQHQPGRDSRRQAEESLSIAGRPIFHGGPILQASLRDTR